ncbi:hypothetical protein MBRA1_002828 [Malassezia brasiliensis]|uniref:TatD related DNase n=1 Tax=Malassezia brasiliensis TaxID=1821822 RepID=A0AAF0DVM4_9BASI|nr:hypothetical protein MBRA1_002828 [Malassezia brasiliensis]
MAEAPASVPAYVEIAVNLGDPMFRGVYHDKEKHPDDLAQVLDRAERAGVRAQIITAGSLAETDEVLHLAQLRPNLYATAGCHPTRSTELTMHKGGPSAYIAALQTLVDAHRLGTNDGRIVAIGECGLADAQKTAFDAQLALAETTQLPLFLHSRAAHADFVQVLRPHLAALRRNAGITSEPNAAEPGCVGVVHSFTGTADELRELLSLGLFVGVNGCSLKTAENLEVVRQIPLHRIMLETDAPWCDLRSTHASAPLLEQFRREEPQLAALYTPPRAKPERWSATSAVKGRNEPCCIGEVAAVVARVHNVRLAELAEHALRNAARLFRI